jgi:hypothetical protein
MATPIKFEMITIIDLEGKEIEVTDLKLALMQADDFRHYSTIDPGQVEFCLKQQLYWEGIYQKLARLADG